MDKPADPNYELLCKAQSAPVDVSVLNDMLGPQEATQILKMFVESSHELIEHLDNAVRQRDIVQVQDAAHTLKGACSSVGANDMWRECIELEQAVSASDWTQIPIKCSLLGVLCQQARTFLQNKL